MPHHVHGHFKEVNLVSDLPGEAKFQDTTLLNPWGLVRHRDTTWIAVNHSGTLTNYDINDSTLNPFYVTLALSDQSSASPTGLVQNKTKGFRVNNTPSFLLTCTEDGVVFAYVPSVDQNNGIIVIDNSTSGAIYKGLEIADEKLYVTDFHNGQVNVFDSNFNQLSGFSFVDPSLPFGYAPFNIVKMGHRLFVSFALQDENAEDNVSGPGLGYVSIFEYDGTFLRRFASQNELNAPWGMARGIEDWHLENAVLIGNFGDGVINVYSHCGKFLGSLTDKYGNIISLDGLWDIKFDDHKLYFAAGTNDEADGLTGFIKKD